MLLAFGGFSLESHNLRFSYALRHIAMEKLRGSSYPKRKLVSHLVCPSNGLSARRCHSPQGVRKDRGQPTRAVRCAVIAAQQSSDSSAERRTLSGSTVIP